MEVPREPASNLLAGPKVLCHPLQQFRRQPRHHWSQYNRIHCWARGDNHIHNQIIRD